MAEEICAFKGEIIPAPKPEKRGHRRRRALTGTDFRIKISTPAEKRPGLEVYAL